MPQTSLEIPFDDVIGTVEIDGKPYPVKINPVWQQHLGQVGQAAEKLREAAQGMDTLAASPTTTEIATAWNETRTTLQEIV